MSPYNGFILSIILMLPGAFTPLAEHGACQSMDATVTVVTAAADEHVIQINAPRDAHLIVYLLVEQGDLPVEVPLRDGKIRDVAKGQYDVILQDTQKRYCIAVHRVTVN
jgi:hypothetical protein